MTRIVQYLVDAAVIYVLAVIAGFALGISGAVGAAFAYLVGSAILFGYFWLADSTGGTIGRRLMGLKLVDDEGNAPTPDMVLIRSLMFVISLMIPILQLPFLFKLTLSPFTIESGLSETGQGLHDLAGATFVVRSAQRSGSARARALG